MLEQKCCQVSVFTEGKQVHLVQGVNFSLAVVIDNLVRDKQRTALV